MGKLQGRTTEQERDIEKLKEEIKQLQVEVELKDKNVRYYTYDKQRFY